MLDDNRRRVKPAELLLAALIFAVVGVLLLTGNEEVLVLLFCFGTWVFQNILDNMRTIVGVVFLIIALGFGLCGYRRFRTTSK